MIENTFAPERVRERGGGERRDIVVRVPEHDCNQFKWNISIWETINEGILLYVPWLPWMLCSLIILALWSHINLVQLFIEYNAVENARLPLTWEWRTNSVSYTQVLCPWFRLSFSPSILPSIGMETYHGLSGHMSYIFFSLRWAPSCRSHFFR